MVHLGIEVITFERIVLYIAMIAFIQVAKAEKLLYILLSQTEARDHPEVGIKVKARPTQMECMGAEKIRSEIQLRKG